MTQNMGELNDTAITNAEKSVSRRNEFHHFADMSTNSSSDRNALGFAENDPYQDVRARMEKLAEMDRTRHLNDDGDAYSNTKDGFVESIPFFAAITTYLGYAVLIVVGHIRDICAAVFRNGRYLHPATKTPNSHDIASHKLGKNSSAGSHEEDGPSQEAKAIQHYDPTTDSKAFAPLLKSWENFYTRRCYHRIQDCFNRPIASGPGAVIQMLERVSGDGNKTMQVLGSQDASIMKGNNISAENNKFLMKYVSGPHVNFVDEFDPLVCASCNTDGSLDCHHESSKKYRITRQCLNLGSYNYLGLADDWFSTCQEEVVDSFRKLSISCSSSRQEYGTTSLHKKAERIVAEFLQKEDAIVFNMGFNTNATTIPAFVNSSHDLILSDELNHTSIVNGARASGATIKTFRHNDACHLEQLVRDAIVTGHQRTRRPWNKIMVIVEGIYSMEGEYCNLRAISSVCRKYHLLLYLDEAHSIGAMGLSGRGCCEYTGVDTSAVDIMMGTFTKSFGGMGGYIAGKKNLIDFLRKKCSGSLNHNSLSPVVCQQVISSFKVIMGRDGTSIGQRKLSALRDNSNYFRMRLSDLGLHVLGNYDSPIMPVMLYNPTKIAAFSRECLKRGLAVVVVGFPAVPILMSRARFCISAGHTREQLDDALKQIEEVADVLRLRYRTYALG